MSRKTGFFHIFLGVVIFLSTALIVLSLVRISRNPALSEEASAPYEFLGEAEPSVKLEDAESPIVRGNPFFAEVERPFSIPAEGVVILDDETFAAAYDELYDRRDSYYGREIELSGYVMAQEGLAEGGFLVGRDLLWCCTTDNYFIGFLALADGSLPVEGDCVRLRGTITAASYTNPETGAVFDVPAIRVVSLADAKDVPRMVYPY